MKFHSEAGGFMMFGDVALRLLRMMGHSGTVPSAIRAEDMPAAIEKLETALRGAAGDPAPPDDGRDENGQPNVGLRQRAVPLLDLLRRAAANGSSVTWDKA